MARLTATLPCIADSYVSFQTSSTSNTNYGGAIFLRVGVYESVFMKFDLSQVPRGSVIHSAYLSLYSYNANARGFSNGRTLFDMWHGNNPAWDEYGITQNNAPNDYMMNSQPRYPAGPDAVEQQVWNVEISGYLNMWINGVNTWDAHGALHFVRHNSVSGDSGGTTEFYSRNVSPASIRPRIIVDFTSPNDAPYAPNLNSPGNGVWYTGSPTVSWSFSDPNPGDTQGAWAVNIIDHNTNAVVRDTGWQGGGTSSWAISPPLPDGRYRYRVYTRDQFGAQSPPSWEPVFYVDATAPTGTVQGSQTLSVSPGGTFRVNATANDNFSGVSLVRFPTAGPGYGFTWYDGINDGGGNWHFNVPIGNYNNNEGVYTTHVYVNDAAGNQVMIGAVNTTVDRTKANDPNILASNIKSNSVTFTWNGFADPAPSSGYWRTQLYVRKNGVAGSVDIDSNGSVEDFLTFSDNRTSYIVNNLVENTSYSFVVTHYDLAGNESNYTWKTVQTNSRPTAQLLNLTGNGYLMNQRPKIRVSGNDLQGSAMNFHIQISNVSNFATTIVDAFAVGGTGWISTSPVGNGVVNMYTPQIDIGTGTKYIRVQANDGQEWGDYTATVAFVVQAATWVGTIKPTDTTASKRWVDDLRAKVNAIRQERGLSLLNWTDSALRDWNHAQGGTLIRAVHITELRTAMQDVATIFGATLTWTITNPTGANRTGQEWLELRNAAVTL